MDEIDVFNEHYLKIFFNHYIEVGIGLHVGKVIFGNRGLGLNNNLAAMGPPVNVAARLQAATKQLNNSFIISEYALELLKPQTQDAATATVELKGIVEEQKVRLIGRPFIK